MTRKFRWVPSWPWVLLAAAFLAGISGSAAALPTRAPVSGLTTCGTDQAAPELVNITIPDGPSVFQHFPSLGITPELVAGGSLAKGPLTVVAFAGEVCGLPLLPPFVPNDVHIPPPTNVLRISRPDGFTLYFSDVDFSTAIP